MLPLSRFACDLVWLEVKPVLEGIGSFLEEIGSVLEAAALECRSDPFGSSSGDSFGGGSRWWGRTSLLCFDIQAHVSSPLSKPALGMCASLLLPFFFFVLYGIVVIVLLLYSSFFFLCTIRYCCYAIVLLLYSFALRRSFNAIKDKILQKWEKSVKEQYGAIYSE